jgi:glycosyltransferase involved in cell wall biosynthesis
MKKVLFLSPMPPPYYGSAMSSEMCLNILKDDGNFSVKNIRINLAEEMADVGRLGFRKIMGVLNKRSEIEKGIKEFRPDLTYFMPATSKAGLFKDFLFARTVRKFGRDVVYHIRSRMRDEDKKSWLKRMIYKKMFKGSSVIVLDELLKGDVEEYFMPKEIFVLPNAIENSVSSVKLDQMVKKRSVNKKFEILFLSNMYESKGWFLVLQACELLKKESSDFVCNFIGKWPSDIEEKKFFDFVREKNLSENVKYLGGISGKEKDLVYERVNAFVFPTYYELEAHPRVIIESMMFGLPIVANSHCSIPNTILDKKTGFLLKENSPKEIKKYLQLIKKNKKMGVEIGLAGRKRFLEKYELKKYKKGFIDIMKRV